MTLEQAREMIRRADMALMNARQQISSTVRHTGGNTIIIDSKEGRITVLPGGKVIFTPLEEIPWAEQDSLKKSADFTMYAASAGTTCPSCGGSGVI